MKIFFTRCISFLFLLGMTTVLSAQVVYWGDEPGQGDFDGGLNGWTSNTVSTTGIDTTWEWVSNGLITGGLVGAGQDVTIASPTASNGAMVFNADKFSTAATGNVPPQPYPQYVEELISPTIDLSAVPEGTAMAIQFSQAFLWLQEANGYNYFSNYSVSTDDGATWSPLADCNPGAPNLSTNSQADLLNNTVNRRIPVGLNAAGSSTVRIKFTFAGNFYVWALDDIKITERAIQNDVSVAEGWYATSPNKMIPISQVEPMSFMTDVGNFGGNTAGDVVLNLSITDDSGTEVYSVNEVYGTLAADSLDENRIFGDFTPSNIGVYTATYQVTSDSMDQNMDNNTLSFSWEVTEGTFAKEDDASSSIQPLSSNWDEDIAESWSFGNHFYIVNGGDLKGNFAEFVIDNPNASADLTVNLKLFKWNAPVDEWSSDPDPVGSAFYFCSPDDREIAGRATYTIMGNEGNGIISVPLLDELSLLQGVTLEDNTHYILMVEIINTDDDASNIIALGANREVNYQPSNFAYRSIGFPRNGSMLGINTSGPLDEAAFNYIGFGQEVVPVVRLVIGEKIVSNTVNILEGAKVNIFPSPADKDMTVEVELAQLYDDASVSIIDAAGRMLSTQHFTSLQTEYISYNTTNWANGNYFLRVATKDGVKTKSFIVQH